MTLTSAIKRRLLPYPRVLRFASLVWMSRRPSVLVEHLAAERFRSDCYRRFESGDRRVFKNLAGYDCEYEAISPKNYWHLCIGSQHEDSFMNLVFRDVLRPGMVILDIGGHVGLWAVPLAKHVGPTGKVYVFEPETLGYTATLRNVALNHLDNVSVMQMAIADRTGTESFYVRPDKDTHSLFVNTLAPSPTGRQDVRTVEMATVDHLIEHQIIPPPNFVKIDVEGAELKVLDGMKRSASRIEGLLVEVHADELALNGVGDPYAAVEERVTALGFPKHQYVDPIHLLATR